MTGLRMDKWLWAARFFKTRSIASHACELGRVESRGTAAKASREVRVGDMLKIRTEVALYEIEVLALSERRGPAAEAQLLYRETEASRAARALAIEERRSQPRFEGFDAGRPSKRDRRKMDWARGRD